MILLFFIFCIFIATLLSIASDDEKITLKSVVEHVKENRQVNAIILFVGIVFETFVQLIK
jgi:hypothetical protein